jgi:membrane-associated protease RseP (regulator of RpoE activity)
MLDALLAHKWTLIFYTAVFLFVFFNRKKFDRHFKIVFLYRTKWGLKLMDSIAGKQRELVKLLGYIGLGAGFIGMAIIVGFLFKGVYNLIFVPGAPPTISPVLPGVPIPGGLFIPLWQGLIAIFIVAVVHEFAHGIIARAHNVPVKSSGPAIIGPLFAAFVEPDEKKLKKQSDIVQYSVFAAGPFSNMLLGAVIVLIMSAVFNPLLGFLYAPIGISFSSVQEGFPAEKAGMQPGEIYTSFNGRSITTVNDLVAALETVKVDQSVVIATATNSYTVKTTSHPNNPDKPYLGVIGLQTRFNDDHTITFRILQWFDGLFVVTFILSVGIGLANLLPIGPLDGGRMFHLAMQKTRGHEKGTKTWARTSIFFLLVILFLFTPIFKSTIKALIGVFG